MHVFCVYIRSYYIFLIMTLYARIFRSNTYVVSSVAMVYFTKMYKYHRFALVVTTLPSISDKRVCGLFILIFNELLLLLQKLSV